MSSTNRPLIMVKDWRGPGKWTQADLAREADWVSINPAWPGAPIPGAVTLAGVPPAYITYEGEPAGALADIGREAIRRGYDLFEVTQASGFVKSQRIPTWVNGVQATWALNMARMEVATWYGAALVKALPWVDGFHIDYWTSLGWLFDGGWGPMEGAQGVAYPDTFWPQFDNGLGRMAHTIRRMRPGRPTILIGQQWQNATRWKDGELTGRFVEEYPSRWCGPVPWKKYNDDQFAAFRLMNADPLNVRHVMELRFPGLHSTAYVQDVLHYCIDRGYVLSWGEDAASGYGVPLYVGG